MKISEKIRYYDESQGALGYSDVMLVPRHSDILSRHGDQVDTSTVIAKGMRPINIPIVTAGMDTVTESEMAITIALQGGIGEVHRNNLPPVQAAIIRTVKDRLRVMEDEPPKITEQANIFEARKILKKRKRGYIIVYPGPELTGQFSGMATPRDFEAGEDDTPISAVMTRFDELDIVPAGTSLEQAVEVMRDKRREKIPMVDDNRNLIGMFSMKDQKLYEKYPRAALDINGRLMVGGAIGIKEIDLDRAHELEEAGADVLFVDVAHGDNENVGWIMGRLKNGDDRVRIPVILGNFAVFTDEQQVEENIFYAIDLGADGIKIGVGPGFACKTRDIAGVGVPQLTAILNARSIMDGFDYKIPIIADGGIRIPHDLGVAIAAGADAVMIGSVFAGTSDSPGNVLEHEGKQVKLVRGMASPAVFNDRLEMGDITTGATIYSHAAEGDEKLIPYQGDTKNVIFKYLGGLRSAMSYSKSHNIEELQKAIMIRVSQSGAEEHTRDLG